MMEDATEKVSITARESMSRILVALAATVAAATFVHAFLADRESRTQLDGLLRELGGSVAETAAAGLRASLGVLDELERELDESLRLKAKLLATPAAERARDESRVSRVVFIGRNLDRAALLAGLQSCIAAPVRIA